jgi:hypothetical protein
MDMSDTSLHEENAFNQLNRIRIGFARQSQN